MGNSLKAFSIIKDRLSKNSLSVQAWYYYYLSAIDFLEPHEEILSKAINYLEKDAKIEKKMDFYYAGKLYLLNGQTEKANHYFDQISESDPLLALYSKISIGIFKEDDEMLIETSNEIEKIKNEKRSNAESYNADPFILFTLGTTFFSLCDKIRDKAIFYELTEEIQYVNIALGASIEHNAFYDLLSSSDENDDGLETALRLVELKNFEEEILIELEMNCGMLDKGHFYSLIYRRHEQIGALEILRSTISSKPDNLTMDEAIAIAIYRSIENCESYLNGIIYLYLDNKIDNRQLLRLYVYILKLKLMGSDYSPFVIVDEISIRATDLLGRYLHSPLSPSTIYRMLSWIAVKSDINLKIDRSQDDLSDFSVFNAQWYENLGFLQSQIIKWNKQNLSF